MSGARAKHAALAVRRRAALISRRSKRLKAPAKALPEEAEAETSLESVKMKKSVLPVLLLLLTGACAAPSTPNNASSTTPAAGGGGDAAFKTLHDRYVVEFLRRNPTVNTYLGGAGLDPGLRETDGRLRDHSATALVDEDRWLTTTMQALETSAPDSLSPAQRINRDVALAQINFLLHQHQERRYQERALDTYTD